MFSEPKQLNNSRYSQRKMQDNFLVWISGMNSFSSCFICSLNLWHCASESPYTAALCFSSRRSLTSMRPSMIDRKIDAADCTSRLPLSKKVQFVKKLIVESRSQPKKVEPNPKCISQVGNETQSKAFPTDLIFQKQQFFQFNLWKHLKFDWVSFFSPFLCVSLTLQRTF